MEMWQKWSKVAGIILLCVILTGIGFYFGYKTREAHTANLVDSGVLIAAKEIEKKEIKALEVVGVFWILPNKDPICPENHPVKGTFGANSGNFYTKDNKSYERVKPDICFATEEFARDKAGFIKKF